MCKKWVAIFEVKVTVTEFGFTQWNHDYFYYIFWTADFLATNLVWQCMFISWSVLWKSCFAVFKVKVTVKILNFSKCFARTIYLIGQTWYGDASSSARASFRNMILLCSRSKTIVSTRSSEILKLLQSRLVWWCIITRQGKDFLAFT